MGEFVSLLTAFFALMVIKSIRSGTRHPWTILCDFDGTISFKDVTDTLLEAFGMPGWEALEQRWEDGEIGSRECMAGQIALLDASQDELNACLAGIAIDPAFAAFADHARLRGVPLHIVSDGLDYAIRYILRANGVQDIPVIANQLRPVSERRWNLDFPYHNDSCLKASGTCKCSAARAVADDRFLMIGDGRSDFCVSQIADHVFARKSLVTECEHAGVPFTVMNDFSNAAARLDWLLDQAGTEYFTPADLLLLRGMHDRTS